MAKRRQKAERAAAKLKNSGQALSPVTAGRGAIARTFWGKAWCENLERYSDYSNRLPRGRTYLRNGSVIDLKIRPGDVAARVMGSSLYSIRVKISEVPAPQWRAMTRDCAQSIDSLVELLQGQLSTAVMERITRPGTGLLPSPKEIAFSCSCPDSAAMCKHVAATLYGIGTRLDREPALLFSLRKVDAKELIARAGESGLPGQKKPAAGRILDSSRLADVFGIDLARLDPKPQAARSPAVAKKKVPAPTRRKAETQARKSIKRRSS
ncbi:MAG TPA: hypothetical protein VN848_09320 [Gemmatimonadales bacterium]|nr:hypothetical protein [Gemmatimonadales bacterium]